MRAPEAPPAPGGTAFPGLALPLLLAVVAACGSAESGGEVEEAGASETLPTDTAPGIATAGGDPDPGLSEEDVEAGRHDASWRRFVDAGRTSPADTTPNPESWEDITPESVNSDRTHLPLHGDVAGPSVVAVQILLDRALYRPGVIDGRWGKNTEKAVYWMEEAEGLEADGRVDREAFRRLVELAGAPDRLVVERELTETDVSGPFVQIPEDVYERAELDCLCYESQREQLGERFHATPELLERLNPDTDLNAVRVGDRLRVPNVRPFAMDSANRVPPVGRMPRAEVAELVVSDGGHYVHARDAEGNLLYHFPSTLGSDYAPSPEENYEIDSIHQDPIWHYKPDLLTGVDPSRPDAMLPPGPNNAVGVVWMQLTKPHYGIHGTSAPSTIGYATSHGCIRLTNWDAEFLSHQVDAGVPVRFIGGSGRGSGGG